MTHEPPPPPSLRVLAARSTLGELAGINTTILNDGALVYVTSNRDVYALLKDSTDAPDGSNVVASLAGPGRWFKTGLSQSSWQTQTDWYVDEQNATGLASDSNTGDTATTPLLSYADSGLLNWQGTGSVPWNNQGSGVTSALIDVGSDIPTNSQLVLGAPGGNFYATAYGCLIRSSQVQTAGTSFEACRLGTTNAVTIDLYSTYESFLTACSLRRFGGGPSFCRIAGAWSTFANTSFGSSRIVSGISDASVIPTVIRPDSISLWDWAGAAVQITEGSLVRLLGACWGTSTRGGSTSFRVATGAYCSYPPGTPPTVIGTEANNCNVGGAAGSYAGLPIPFFNPANGAALVETAP